MRSVPLIGHPFASWQRFSAPAGSEISTRPAAGSGQRAVRAQKEAVSEPQTACCQLPFACLKLQALRGCSVLVLAVLLLVFPTPASIHAQKKVSTVDDAKVYREAMVWFKKAEAMIGTPKENSEEQAELFRKALEIKPDFLEAHYDLGLIYANQKKMKEAVKEFETVLKLEPNFEGIHFLLASGYRELGSTSAAITALVEGLKKKPKDLQMLRALAYLQFNSADDAAARNPSKDPGDRADRCELPYRSRACVPKREQH